MASDIGDYANWTTGEAASGRIMDAGGPIVRAEVKDGDVRVYTRNAEFRMRYVGGIFKWMIERVRRALAGCAYCGRLRSVNSVAKCESCGAPPKGD